MKTCSICGNPRRPDIDGALLDGRPLRAICSEFNVAKTSLLRHRDHHLRRAETRRTASAPALEPSAPPAALLSELGNACKRLHRLARKAERAGDLRGAVAATDAMAKQLQGVIRLAVEQERRRDACLQRGPDYQRLLAAHSVDEIQAELTRKAAPALDAEVVAEDPGNTPTQ